MPAAAAFVGVTGNNNRAYTLGDRRAEVRRQSCCKNYYQAYFFGPVDGSEESGCGREVSEHRHWMYESAQTDSCQDSRLWGL